MYNHSGRLMKYRPKISKSKAIDKESIVTYFTLGLPGLFTCTKHFHGHSDGQQKMTNLDQKMHLKKSMLT